MIAYMLHHSHELDKHEKARSLSDQLLRIRKRIRIKLYFTLVLKTINISFKLSVTNGNNFFF